MPVVSLPGPNLCFPPSLHCTWPQYPSLQGVGPIGGSFMKTFQAMPGQTPWVKAWHHKRASLPGLAPGVGLYSLFQARCNISSLVDSCRLFRLDNINILHGSLCISCWYVCQCSSSQEVNGYKSCCSRNRIAMKWSIGFLNHSQYGPFPQTTLLRPYQNLLPLTTQLSGPQGHTNLSITLRWWFLEDNLKHRFT